MLSTLIPHRRDVLVLAAALILAVAGRTALAQSVWPVPQPVLLPLTGDIVTDTGGRGFVVASQAGGSVALTDSAVLPIDTAIHELVSAQGDWLTMRGLISGTQVRKSLGSGVLPVESCPGLIPGGEGQVGYLHCTNGVLRRMNGLAATDLYAMPAGYRLRDVWTSSKVLLERTSDQMLVMGVLRGTPLAISRDRVLGVALPDLLERLQIVDYLTSVFVVYRTVDGYRVVGDSSTSAPVDAAGEPLSHQQCIAGDISANRLVAVERVNGELKLQTYSTLAPAVLLRQDALEAGDRLVCARTTPGGIFTGPYILRTQTSGDQIFRAGGSGLTLVHSANDPVRGAGRLLSVGPMVFVRYADGSVYRLESPGAPAQQIALFAPFEFPRPIEVGTAPTDPVREYALSRDAATGMAQLSITARIPGQSPVISELPLGADLTSSGFTDVRQVLRQPGWPAGRLLIAVGRKVTASEPSGAVYFSVQETQTPLPLLDQAGAQPTLNSLVLSGSHVHALHSTTSPPTLMRFGSDGSNQGETQLEASQLVGQADGSVLAIRISGLDIIVAQVSGNVVQWQRTFGTGCRVLDFDAFPLVSCEPSTLANATLSRLDPINGATVWQRLITPLDGQLIFQARVAWAQDADLRLLSWGRYGTSRAIAAARLNPASGALLDVSNPIPLSAANFSLLGVYGFPYIHRWIHLQIRDGTRRQRVAIRVDSNGSITANLMGQSLTNEQVYLSEIADRIATNEGAGWYLSGQVQGISTTNIRAYPITTLSQRLSMRHTVRPWPGREDRAGVDVTVTNPNSSSALAARLHVGLLDCPEIDRLSATIEFNVPANGERTFGCAAYFNADSPTETTAYLRQPLNGVLVRDFVTEEMSIGTLGRDGFEGEVAQ